MSDVDAAGDGLDLPAWAQLGEKRRAHVARVTDLLDQWAIEMTVPADERLAWRDAGRWHDALRDAPEPVLRRITGDENLPYHVLHGPAAARCLVDDGETRAGMLEAIRWHTLGNPDWDRTGRALYMADFLEPGRPFSRTDRAFLAAHVPRDFDGVFRQVVRVRIEWAVREGKQLYPETTALWNRVR